MLKKIRIKGFQCHEDLTIRFDPKITAIIGPSDVGKSAVLRAIRWVATNRPLGEGFIHYGSDESVVRLWSSQGKVERKRGDVNTYRVNETTLEGFGAGVPSDVFDTLKIDEVNFQGQHESPFWFALSPGEVAQRLNDIVDLSDIDEVLKSLGSRQRQARSEVKVVEQRLKEATEEYESTGWVTDLDKLLIKVESYDEPLVERTDTLNDLTSIIDEIRDEQASIKSRSALIETGLQVQGIGAQCVELAQDKASLDWIIRSIEDLTKIVARPLPVFTGLEEIASQVVGARSRRDELLSLINSYYQVLDDLDRTDKQLDECRSEMKSVKQCPLCGGEL